MLLILVIILWLLLADSIWSFIIPILCIIIRAAYKDKNIRLFKLAPLVFSVIYFFINVYFVKYNMDFSLLISLRIIVFSVLLLHIFETLESSNFKKLPRFNFFLYYGIRLFSIFFEKFGDTYMLFKLRKKHIKWWKIPGLLKNMLSNCLLEGLLIYKQINLVNYEKGLVDKAKYIELQKNKQSSIKLVLVGDFILLLLVLIPSFVGSNSLLPKSIVSFITFIKSGLV
jgi:hypothetical protein